MCGKSRSYPGRWRWRLPPALPLPRFKLAIWPRPSDYKPVPNPAHFWSTGSFNSSRLLRSFKTQSTMAPVQVLLPLLAALSALPGFTLAVDLRRYVAHEACKAQRYFEYINARSLQCVNMAGGTFRAFSCYGCDGFDTHTM